MSRRLGFLEVFTAALGVLFFILSAVCVAGAVVIVANWSDPDVGFFSAQPFGWGIKGLGLGLMVTGAIVTFAVGRWLAADHIKEWIRRLRNREE
jgi:membrane protease YdiL (CAAX protease family)